MMENQDPFVSLPSAGKGPGVLVLHAWWGLNDFMKQFCTRLSAHGFAVFAPDLYHGRIARTIPEAEVFRGKMQRAQAQADILAALSAMQSHPGVSSPAFGLVGFSLGAYFALGLVNEQPHAFHAVTLFYGTRGGMDFSSSPAAFQGHFADSDPYTSPSGISKLEKELRKAGRPVEFFTYPTTGHWFFESDRPEAFHPQAAELAWQRTLNFLKTRLAG